jgi:hypothetical protein
MNPHRLSGASNAHMHGRRATMSTLPKDKIAGLLGALTGVAGALLVAAIVGSADPLGRAIGALLGASIAFALVGSLFRNSSYDSGSIRRGPKPEAAPLVDPAGPTAIATPSLVDATAWTGDEQAPDFAPVVSLTEVRVQRRRRRERAPAEAAGA